MYNPLSLKVFVFKAKVVISLVGMFCPESSSDQKVQSSQMFQMRKENVRKHLNSYF